MGDALQGVLRIGGPFHCLEDCRAGMLQRHIQVGQDLALRHQRNDFIHMRVGIDIMQSHPHPEIAQGLRQFGHAGFDWPPAPEAGLVFHVHAVSAGILRNYQ